MKIAQYYKKGNLHLGLVEDDSMVPVDFHGTMQDYIINPRPLRASGKPFLSGEVKFAPPVTRPSKIIAIGLNYLDHIKESHGEMPEAPIVFAKFPNSLTGHQDQIRWRAEMTRKVDFEAELAVIIGKEVSCCEKSDALDVVFGYTCANDVSARDLQFGDGQWVRGKSLDTFCPLGPCIVTPDDIPDPHDLTIKCRVNGTLMQNSHTSLMIFKIPHLISFLSHCFTLLPGDVILTGTPHGVGAFRNPSIYLKDGDEIIVEIEGIGKLFNICHIVKNPGPEGPALG